MLDCNRSESTLAVLEQRVHVGGERAGELELDASHNAGAVHDVEKPRADGRGALARPVGRAVGAEVDETGGVALRKRSASTGRERSASTRVERGGRLDEEPRLPLIGVTKNSPG